MSAHKTLLALMIIVSLQQLGESFLLGAEVSGLLTRGSSVSDAGLRNDRSGRAPPMWQMKTYTAKDFGVNWQRPDAKGNFGRVYFGTQGFGGQVVVKCPNADNFAMTVFETERVVNEKLDQAYSQPRWAKFLGDIKIDDSTPLPPGVGRTGLAYKREAGVGNSLEDFLVDGKDLAGKLGIKKEAGIRPELCRKVMGELLVTCVQMHKVGIIHRDIKPENVLVVGGGVPLKLIDFGSACDTGSGLGVKDISLDPTYAPPERRITPAAPGKYDVYSVAVTGMRCLFPALGRDPRPGIDQRDPSTGVSLAAEFSESELGRAGHKLEAWRARAAAGKCEALAAEAALAGGSAAAAELLGVMEAMLSKSPPQRLDAAQALRRLGPAWARFA